MHEEDDEILEEDESNSKGALAIFEMKNQCWLLSLLAFSKFRYKDANSHIMFIIPNVELIAHNCQAALIIKRQTIWG